MSVRRRYSADDRGSEAVELAILLPIGAALIAMLVLGARVALVSERIGGVAGTAARDASIARSPQAARQAARSSAMAALSAAGLHCANVRVNVDTSGFAVPPGRPAGVRVDVWCTVRLSDVAVDGMPGTKTLHDSGSSPLDPARDVSLGFRNSEARSVSNRRAGA